MPVENSIRIMHVVNFSKFSKFYLKSAKVYTNQHDKHELWGALWPTDILKQNSKSITKQTHTDTDMVKDIHV